MLICLSQNVQKVALLDSIVVERGVEKRQREAAPRGGLKLKGAPSVEPQITIHFHFLVQWLFWDKILRRFQIMTKVKENSFSVNHPNSVKPCHISWSTCINFETETTDVFFLKPKWDKVDKSMNWLRSGFWKSTRIWTNKNLSSSKCSLCTPKGFNLFSLCPGNFYFLYESLLRCNLLVVVFFSGSFGLPEHLHKCLANPK